MIICKYKLADLDDLPNIYRLLLDNQDTLGEYNDERLRGVETRVMVKQCLCVFKNKELIGVVGYELSKLTCDICDLCVASEYRHQGYGRKLVKWAIDDAQKCSTNLLTPRIQALASNKIANEFYSKIGVVVAEDKKDGSILYHIKKERVAK